MPNHRGYSMRFVEAVRAADQTHIGVKLANLCIKREVPVGRVAEWLGVTRATVYSWFTGRTTPRPEAVAKIVGAFDLLRADR